MGSEDGRLAKLSRHSRLQVQKEEERKLKSLLQVQKGEIQKPIAKSYPLPKPVTEEAIYSEVLYSYQIRDPDRLLFFSKELGERYPYSVFNDNAIYLRAQLNLAFGLPSEALRDFEKILREYPAGNKRISALFGKGVAYRKLQLFKYAEQVYKEIKKTYPGSPEFYKVELEEKLLELEKKS